MKTKIFVLCLVAAVFIFVSNSLAQKEKKPAWKGKIEIEGGVKVIKNPEKPLYGEIKFDLEEDLQIGKEDDDNYIFERIYDVKADSDGNICALDGKAGRIQKYDKKGTYLRTIGKKGQGPGEFQMPFGLFIHHKTGLLYVQDMIRIKLFDNAGKYQKETVLRNYPSEFSVDDDGNFWVVANKRLEKGEFKSLEKVGMKGEAISSIVEVPYRIYTKQTGKDSMVTVVTGFEHDLHFAKIDEGAFIYGYSDKYELTAVDKSGKNLFKMKKEEPAKLIVAPYITGPAAANLPKYEPFFYSILTDDARRIYVLKNNVRATREKPKEFDIYSKDGYFLYKTTLPYGRAFCIRNSYLYARHILEDTGLEVVKRLKIKNWSSIKNSAEGIK